MDVEEFELALMRRILRERVVWRKAEDSTPALNSPAVEAHKGAERAYRDILQALTGEYPSACAMEERLKGLKPRQRP
jgi:hypothetical protein